MQKQYRMQNKTFDTDYVTAQCVDGIVEVQYKEDVYITLREAEYIVKERLKFFGNEKYPCLLRSSRLKGINRAGRNYFFGEGLVNLLALALVPKNKVEKMLTTILVTFERPKIPCRVFKSHDEARGWLKQYIKESHV